MNISFPYEHKTKHQTIYLLPINNNFLCHKMICHTDNMEQIPSESSTDIFSFKKLSCIYIPPKASLEMFKNKNRNLEIRQEFFCLLHQVVSWEKSTENLSSEYLNFDLQMNKYQLLPVIVRNNNCNPTKHILVVSI